METILVLAILLAPLTLAVLALLFFGSRHIHRQMDDIVESPSPLVHVARPE